jgi:hypothetical protein
MPRRIPLAFLTLSLSLLARCAHGPPRPPSGMARLIIKCCFMCERSPTGELLDHGLPLGDALVFIDDGRAGTCADWSPDGRIVPAGHHTIIISVPESSPHLQENCCETKDVYVTLRDREVRTEDICMSGRPPPDG